MPVRVTVKGAGEDKVYVLSPGESIFELLMRQENIFLSFCGGKGLCGRCRIQFVGQAPLPKAEERRFILPDELRAGMRLACLARPNADCSIILAFPEEKKRDIITIYDNTYVNGRIQKEENSKIQEEGKKKLQNKQIVAIDLGTTTIAMQLLDAWSGRILKESRFLNPQRKWGPDVISRMEASISGERKNMQQVTVKVLEEEIRKLTTDTDVLIAIAGNTVMEHILNGFDVTGMSVYPFTPIQLNQMELDIGAYHAILLPGISSFVGADITAGIYALGMQNSEEINLLLDLGTNGEMVLGNRSRMIATATAAGPAFDGGTLSEVAGSDMITVTAQLLEEGILDETGLFKEPYFRQGYQVQKACIYQQDIRNLQMAKAAVKTGIMMLQEQFGITFAQIAHVYLAGGFGYHLDVAKANRIGMIPKELQGKVIAVGNTSLLGAYLYAREQLKQKEKDRPISDIQINEVESMRRCMKVLNLATQASFEERYLGAMNFDNQHAYIYSK